MTLFLAAFRHPHLSAEAVCDFLTARLTIRLNRRCELHRSHDPFPTGNRWLFFATPDLLASVGDFVEGTQARLHLGEEHMILVSELSSAIIDRVLEQLAAADDLKNRTIPLGDSEGGRMRSRAAIASS